MLSGRRAAAARGAGVAMLIHMLVRDLAIVSRLELELDAGLWALTGETGAGKSILIDALGLVLGDKADGGLMRAGSERIEMVATFDLAQAPAARTGCASRPSTTRRTA